MVPVSLRLRVTYGRCADFLVDVEEQVARGGLLVRIEAGDDIERGAPAELEVVTPVGRLTIQASVIHMLPGAGVAIAFEPKALLALADAAKRAPKDPGPAPRFERLKDGPPPSVRTATVDRAPVPRTATIDRAVDLGSRTVTGERRDTPVSGARTQTAERTRPPSGERPAMATPVSGVRVTTPPPSTTSRPDRLSTPPGSLRVATPVPGTLTAERGRLSTPPGSERITTTTPVDVPRLDDPPVPRTPTRASPGAPVPEEPVITFAPKPATLPPKPATLPPGTLPPKSATLPPKPPTLPPTAAEADDDEPITTQRQPIDDDDGAPEADAPEADEADPVKRETAAQLQAQRIQLALHGDKNQRMAILRDNNKLLHTYVLRNPQLQLDEVVFMARMATASIEMLTAIGGRRDWAEKPEVALALVRNPKTPIPLALKMLDHVGQSELRTLAKQQNVRDAVQRAARKKILGDS